VLSVKVFMTQSFLGYTRMFFVLVEGQDSLERATSAS